ncbi:hypothetical protein ALC56_10662 [Trachymyrmex septentrionalis]|uniref:Uncharacterized protein n=1 Tax=Trachymyrmex septentrionalis TaxID=34720 RepID=A0A151JTQ5_9HYME|nr:hypothetical protein ALC56_10662 [Trachymyrmex septentrionalis]
MGTVIGQQAEMYANSRNEARITCSKWRSTEFLQHFYEEKKNLFYGPGIAN